MYFKFFGVNSFSLLCETGILLIAELFKVVFLHQYKYPKQHSHFFPMWLLSGHVGSRKKKTSIPQYLNALLQKQY